MSRGAGVRWGARMGDTQVLDYVTGILDDRWQKVHMGITAENVAQRYGITRQMQDELALESQRRAANAIASGYFKEQIVPVEIATRKGIVLFNTDEHVRPDVTADELAKMKPVWLSV